MAGVSWFPDWMKLRKGEEIKKLCPCESNPDFYDSLVRTGRNQFGAGHGQEG
jgi:hypothetical protein